MKLQHLINSLALLSTVLIFHSLQDRLNRLGRGFAKFSQALLYTALALIVMTMPIELFTGTRLDTRGAFIALSSFFAGPIGFVLSVLACSAYRLVLGGVGVWIGILGIVLSGAFGLGLGHYLRSKGRDPKPMHFIYIGVFLGFHSLFILLVPGVKDLGAYFQNVFEVAILRIITVFVFGMSELGEIKRQNRERKLTESHQFFEVLQKIGQVGVWIASPQDNQVKLSAQVYQILDRNSETQAINAWKSIDEIIHPKDRELLHHQMMAAPLIQDGSELESNLLPSPVQLRLLRSNGEVRTVWSHLISLNSRKSTFGDEFNKVGLFHDVTEQSLLYDQLAHSAKLATLGKLASMVSHEINNPLTSAMLLSEKLSKALEHDRELGQGGAVESTSRGSALQPLELSHRVNEKLHSISRLVQSIVAFARSDSADRMNLIEPHAIIFESVRTFRDFQISNEREIPIEIDIQEESKPLLGHADRLQQVLINLLTNAHDSFSPEKTDAQIRVIYQLNSQNRILITVEDNGSGMDESVQKRILEPFFTTKAKGKGTGLGLSIASKIIGEMHGSITVNSTPGEGSRFQIEFPIATELWLASEPSEPGATQARPVMPAPKHPKASRSDLFS